MKKQTFNTGPLLKMALLAGCLFVMSCGETPSAKTDMDVKEEMPEELKDTTKDKMEEQSALDKLNTITDTVKAK